MHRKIESGLRRRQLLIGTAALAPIALLVACTGQTAANITQEVVTYGTDVANGIASAVQAMTGVPATTVSAITTIAEAAVTAAGNLSASLSETSGASIITQIQSDFQAVESDVTGLNIGTAAQNILNDVSVALQVLLPLVGILVAAATPTTNAQAALARLHALPRVVFQK